MALVSQTREQPVIETVTSALPAEPERVLGTDCAEQCHCDTFQELVIRKGKARNTESYHIPPSVSEKQKT